MTGPRPEPKNCEVCGAEFYKPPTYSQGQWEEKRLCSVECRHELLRKPRYCKCGCGQRPPDRKLWVPGHLVFPGRKPYVPKPPRPRRYLSFDRYGRCYVMCRGGRTRAAYARILMEGELGRELTSDELVHHINGDHTDDRVENLMVIDRPSHASHHSGARRNAIDWKTRRCSECGCGHDDRTVGCGTCIKRFSARRAKRRVAA